MDKHTIIATWSANIAIGRNDIGMRGTDTAIAPRHDQGSGRFIRSFIVQGNEGGGRTAFGVVIGIPHLGENGAHAALCGGRIAQFEGTVGNINQMTAHIAQCTSAIIPPTSPVERMQVRGVGAHGCRAQP